MSFNKCFKNLFLSFFFVLLLIPSINFAQNISLTVGNATGHFGQDYIPLDIRISNISDTIAGFNFWLQLDRPDLVKFKEGLVENIDTTYWECTAYVGAACVDSALVLSFQSWDFFHVDTSSTIRPFYDEASYPMPTWYTDARSISGTGYDLNFVTLNISGDGIYINPPQNDELLVRLYLEFVDNLPSTITDSVANILMQTDFKDHFSFSDPNGRSLNWTTEEYTDSLCFECTQWSGDDCLNWSLVPRVIGDPIDLSRCDSLDIFTNYRAVYDSTYFEVTNGTFTLVPECGYSSGEYDIGELVALVGYMFGGGDEKTLAQADYDCSCAIDISDLIGFVTFMFNGGVAPGCSQHSDTLSY